MTSFLAILFLSKLYVKKNIFYYCMIKTSTLKLSVTSITVSSTSQLVPQENFTY